MFKGLKRGIKMVDPVDVQQIALAAILSGAIIFFGAAYGIFYALSRLNHKAQFMRYAYAFYGGLAVATLSLIEVLNLTGWWLTLVATLLVGYFIAPRFIWRLSEDVHSLADADQAVSDGKPNPATSKQSAADKLELSL